MHAASLPVHGAMLRGLPIPTVRNCPAARHSTRSVVRGRYQVHTSARSVVSQDMAACIERTQDEQSQPEQQQASVLHLLADAHCHPQLDPANMHEVRSLQSCRLAAMSVAHDVDWDIMMELHKLAGAANSSHRTADTSFVRTAAASLCSCITQHFNSQCAPKPS